MQLRHGLLVTIGTLVVANLLLAFGATALLVRMGPAIEQILEENDYSIEAAEEMLATLAEAGAAPLTAEAHERARQALARARRNVTEEEERPVLDALERELPAAAAGQAEARRRSLAALSELIRVNRAAMRRVDAEAKRLGTAGAWAAVFVGFLSFGTSLLVLARLQERFVRPLVELAEVLESTRQGERFRRCRPPQASREIVQVTEAVNWLLDERLRQEAAAEARRGPGAG